MNLGQVQIHDEKNTDLLISCLFIKFGLNSQRYFRYLCQPLINCLQKAGDRAVRRIKNGCGHIGGEEEIAPMGPPGSIRSKPVSIKMWQDDDVSKIWLTVIAMAIDRRPMRIKFIGGKWERAYFSLLTLYIFVQKWAQLILVLLALGHNKENYLQRANSWVHIVWGTGVVKDCNTEAGNHTKRRGAPSPPSTRWLKHYFQDGLQGLLLRQRRATLVEASCLLSSFCHLFQKGPKQSKPTW